MLPLALSWFVGICCIILQKTAETAVTCYDNEYIKRYQLQLGVCLLDVLQCIAAQSTKATSTDDKNTKVMKFNAWVKCQILFAFNTAVLTWYYLRDTKQNMIVNVKVSKIFKLSLQESKV